MYAFQCQHYLWKYVLKLISALCCSVYAPPCPCVPSKSTLVTIRSRVTDALCLRAFECPCSQSKICFKVHWLSCCIFFPFPHLPSSTLDPSSCSLYALLYSPSQRFQEKGEMKEKRGENEREPLPDATPWHFWNRGFPNLTRYQKRGSKSRAANFSSHSQFSKLSQKYWHETRTQKQCKVSDLP